MRKIDNDPAYPQTLVESLEKNPRSPSPVENATLLYHLVGLKNDFYKLNDELAQAMDDAIQFPNREADVQELRLRKARLDDEIFRVEALTKKVGTEAGRALVARKMMANEDYELVQMRTNLRAAKGGKPLTPEESAEVNRLNQRIEELQKRLSDYESQKENRDSEAQATTTLSNIFKNRGRVEGKTIPKEKLIQQIKAKFDKNEGKDISGLVQKLARHYVGEGVVTRDALIDKIHGVLKLIDPDITRRDTMDAISGYGQYKQLAKDEISVVLRDLKGQMQQVGKLEDMAGGQAPQKTGIERRKPSQEERGLIKQVEEAKRKGGYDVTDPEKQLKSALDAVKTRLTNEIEDLEKQIATREKIVKNKTALQYDDAANQLKARRDELKRQFDEVFPKEPITDAQRLERWKAGIKKRMDDLQEKMDAGNYSKPERRPIVMDEAGLRLKAEYERVKNEFDRKVMAEKLKARTNYEKFSDAFSKWRRGFLLSSPVTLAKLTSAALERMIFTPIEEAMGAAYSKLPVIGKVAGQAPREGGISAKAEAKAITESLTTGMQDAYDVLRTGKSQLDNVFSKREVMPQELIDILGHIHGALKSPVKRAEFARSFQKRAEFAIRNGLDPSDPLVQTRLMAEAFKDAQRSIFMQDNRVVQAWETGLRLLESPDKLTGKTPVGRKAIATAGRFFLPIVKVPTNVVAETLQYATGLVTGSTRLAFAMRKGVENLSEDESDLIMRELKKGSLGGACLLLGYFNPTVFGGYYQSGEKKKQGQAAYGSVQIGGHNIPSFLVHNPLLETFQMGATIRRVADSKLRKKDTETQGIANGVIAGALGLTEEVPFVRQTADMVKILNPNDRQKYFNQIAKDAVIPLGVSWVAQHFDRDAKGNYIPRDPKTLFQSIETGIPGLRENVQKKVKK